MNTKTISETITEYLSNGGLFNPEMMDHEKVRDLLMTCRDVIESLMRDAARMDAVDKNQRSVQFNSYHWKWTTQSQGQTVGKIGVGTNCREAIDNAMGLNPEPQSPISEAENEAYLTWLHTGIIHSKNP